MDEIELKTFETKSFENIDYSKLDFPELDTTGWTIRITDEAYIRSLIEKGYTQKQAKHIAHYNKRKYGILTVEQLYHY